MDVFFADLDNTLIYSYKHDIGINKCTVERYHGREISFITEKTYVLLNELKKRMLLIPVTTRTVEQYSRIGLGIGEIPYALVCNGGVLLKDGRQDNEWYQKSLQMIQESREELQKAVRYLEKEENRMFEVRCIQELFVFTKCRLAQSVVQCMKEALGLRYTDVFYNGEKVYAVPKILNKGTAVRRMKERLGAEHVFAAGDSAFDIPMLEQADAAVMPPEGIGGRVQAYGHICRMPGKAVFSEELLEFVLQRAANTAGTGLEGRCR